MTNTGLLLPINGLANKASSWQRLSVRILAAGFCLGILSWCGLLLSQAVSDEAVIWLANGALLAFLLLTPRREWPWYLAVSIAANMLAHVAFHYTIPASILFSIINVIEAVVAAVLLTRKVKGFPDLSRPAILVQFGFYCGIVAPTISALLAGAGAVTLSHVQPLPFIGNWFIADALGIAIVTPLMLAIQLDQLREILSGKKLLEFLLLSFLLIVAGVVIFSQNRYPLIFLMFPILLLIMFRLGRAGSGIAILLLAIPAIHFTLLSRGPFAIREAGPFSAHVVLLQVFFFTLVVTMYGATATLSERKRLSSELSESEERYRILADHSWDIIVRTDLEGRRRYLSPSVFDVVGWTPEELIGSPSTHLIHPEDQAHHSLMWKELTANSAKLVHSYRMRRKDGSYLWVESKARLVADPGTGRPLEVVSVIRDVSARVAEQQQLMVAYRQAQVLAKIDTLTGLANRRGFDDALQGEWRRAIRDKTQISLLMVDVDNFKSYNDVYGHPAGDACLQAIADTLAKSLQRSSDIATRHGGEEFAILLPNTPAAGAREIAERIRLAVAELHLTSDGRVARESTVSIGLAVARPVRDGEQDGLVSISDQALYAAKRSGKNQVSSWQDQNVAQPLADDETGSEPDQAPGGRPPSE